MPATKEAILKDLATAFPDAVVELSPLVDDDDHWRLVIADKSFQGLSRVMQHKKVYQALNSKITDNLHALQLITKPL